MKWVKIVLGALVALILLCTAALGVAGMGQDANRSQSSVTIHKPPEAVWPWLYKADKVKQWVSWLVEIRETGEGEPTPGGQAVWVMEDRNNGNARMEITGTVDAVEPNRRLAIHMTAPEGFSGTNVYTLTPLAGGATRLDSDGRYTFDNGFARFMTPLILWQAKKKMIGDMDHLRTLVEGGPQ